MSNDVRMFPIQDGATVPWEVMAPHDGQCRRNHCGQSLERIAQRGGLGAVEAWCVVNDIGFDWCWKNPNLDEMKRKWSEFATATNEKYSVLRKEISALKELLHHAYIHSNYKDLGFLQMTTEQKQYFISFLRYAGMEECAETLEETLDAKG